mmetsp:Transcript_2075/g.4842  ORF Transcript_2075/g.4842 Transcript_2075/m.4842 type:complete len:180 (+) Transcript_2075:227-766(+)
MGSYVHQQHRRQQHMPQPQPQPQPQMNPRMMEDFDFEQSNARFNKDGLVQELKKPEEAPAAEGAEEGQEAVAKEPEFDAPAGKAYDKTKSFFDCISCEALDRRQEGGAGKRRSMAEQRKVDVETFGAMSLEHRGHGRGRGRGRGRRGGYNNNRPQHRYNNNQQGYGNHRNAHQLQQPIQ